MKFLCKMNLLLFLILLLSVCSGLIHDLKIVDEDRDLFRIETFGLVEGGKVDLKLSHLSVNPSTTSDGKQHRLALVLHKASRESEIQEFIEKLHESSTCLLDSMSEADSLYLPINDQKAESHEASFSITRSQEGLYALLFVRCSHQPHHSSSTTSSSTTTSSLSLLSNLPRSLSSQIRVSFHLHAALSNPGPDFLSAGDRFLPRLYLFFSVLFLALLLAWICILLNFSPSSISSISSMPSISSIFSFLATSLAAVRKVHWLMLLLLFVKATLLNTQSMLFHSLARDGKVSLAPTLALAADSLSLIKSVLLFCLLPLLGWTIITPSRISRNGKSGSASDASGDLREDLRGVGAWECAVVLAVFCLRCAASALLWLSERAGERGVFERLALLRDWLLALDFASCLLVALALLSSARLAKRAVQDRDKRGAGAINRLKRFRGFCTAVLGFFIFSRVIAILISETVDFSLAWIEVFLTEGAALVFYLYIGFMFRPASADQSSIEESGYEALDSEDREFGLGAEGDDITDLPNMNKLHKHKEVEMI